MKQHFGLDRLYEVCRVARELTYPLNIGRVIARPFLGETAKTFVRTGHRKDYRGRRRRRRPCSTR